MLVSLTRVGPTRQSLAKAVAVTGVDALQLLRRPQLPPAPPSLPIVELVPDERTPELLHVRLPGVWLGTPGAREAGFGYLGAVLAALSGAARTMGGLLHPPGVQVNAKAAKAAKAAGAEAPQPALGGDVHGLHTLDAAEQEVLANLLRRHSPTLIALTGRVRVGGPADLVGSRRLADSREHLAARYLASADPRHLRHVRADIRRRYGIADLSRMDIAPAAGPAGDGEVLVRCVDAQVSLADLRAQALLFAALALKARRMVRNGEREFDVPQHVIEANRARAVVQGLRAQFVPEMSKARTPRPLAAREAARRLLGGLAAELSLLDATAEELLPLLAPVELPALGLPALRTQDLLLRAARQGIPALAQQAERELYDPRPGGGLLAHLAQEAPGRVELLLGEWRRTLADGIAPAPRADRPQKPQRPQRPGGDARRERPQHGSRRNPQRNTPRDDPRDTPRKPGRRDTHE
ncbi:hypothetical protein [Kitasatospora sp. NPDC050543]|uniref:hypothetical protein n=1 Tax=Kitasatospora sp. NPDC050543 TaxID=3364054 RepID=UPI0037B9CEF8